MRIYLWPALLLITACATSGVPIEVPQFGPDDPRVDSAGFIGHTLQLSKTIGATKYTLMAFRVGDTVTLGAMVEGPFDGQVEWHVHGSSLGLPFPAEPTELDPVAEVTGGPPSAEPVVGRRRSFRAFSWINIELPLAAWMPVSPTAIRLTFRPRIGSPIVLPDTGVSYDATFTPR